MTAFTCPLCKESQKKDVIVTGCHGGVIYCEKCYLEVKEEENRMARDESNAISKPKDRRIKRDKGKRHI